jgi:hypothetical protein
VPAGVYSDAQPMTFTATQLPVEGTLPSLADVSLDLVAVTPAGVEAAADWANLKSPETYLGYERSESFASPGGAALNQQRAYTAPLQPTLNEWSLAGAWTIGTDSAIVN